MTPAESSVQTKQTSRPPASRIAARIARAAVELRRDFGSAATEGMLSEYTSEQEPKERGRGEGLLLGAGRPKGGNSKRRRFQTAKEPNGVNGAGQGAKGV